MKKSLENNKLTELQKSNCYTRLNRIAGQVNGIQKMISDDRTCSEVLVQVAAINSAVTGLSREILTSHMKNCMDGSLKPEDYKVMDEFMDICKKLV